MEPFLENSDLLWVAFGNTLTIALAAGALSFVWGTILAAFRVSPIGPLRTFGAVYVEVVRNTPLTLLFLFFLVASTPLLGLTIGLGVPMAIVAMTLYTATFVCEAVRSGVNSVQVGQAEAARSVGLTFIQVLTHVVMPQAFRSVVPPLINVYVAHIKNTSVAAGFAVFELVNFANRFSNPYPAQVVALFFGVGLCFLAMTIPLGLASQSLEKKLVIHR
ncbi:MAG: amino acid ABC transporter permease [Actinobacteria bacterium HGW-Actinobacteria-4]|nr:MAG: amino acid ABC transporter permease [Actinobacteria bacterium HGW-Actinobacteria-4]